MDVQLTRRVRTHWRIPQMTSRRWSGGGRSSLQLPPHPKRTRGNLKLVLNSDPVHELQDDIVGMPLRHRAVILKLAAILQLNCKDEYFNIALMAAVEQAGLLHQSRK